MKNVPTPISDMVMRKVYLRPISVAEAAENQRAERTHGKAGGEGEQREDEAALGWHRRRSISRGTRRASRKCRSRTTRIWCRAKKQK